MNGADNAACVGEASPSLRETRPFATIESRVHFSTGKRSGRSRGWDRIVESCRAKLGWTSRTPIPSPNIETVSFTRIGSELRDLSFGISTGCAQKSGVSPLEIERRPPLAFLKPVTVCQSASALMISPLSIVAIPIQVIGLILSLAKRTDPSSIPMFTPPE